MELKLVSEDDRRSLYELGVGGTWKVMKYLEIKEDSWVGDHYHKNKDEMFFLSKGKGLFIVDECKVSASAPYSLFIQRGVYHKFRLKKGSILICLASELHNANDDHKLT